MNPIAFLFSWYNLPFTLALATGLALALVQLLSGLGDSEAELEAVRAEARKAGVPPGWVR